MDVVGQRVYLILGGQPSPAPFSRGGNRLAAAGTAAIIDRRRTGDG
jgi:hypothetical protein